MTCCASTSPLLEALERDGYATVERVFSPAEVRALLAGLESALASTLADDPAIRGGEGTVYAARNVLRLWPETGTVWRRPPLLDLLSAALGADFGLVRALYFDKPPGNNWALPWHKDLTVAVKNNRLGGTHFARPTRKAGVPHAEAPADVLEAMLTARLHLDDVGDDNGPLKVVPGSHRTGKALRLGDAPVVTLHARAGDVLLIRPLVAHCSNRSRDDTDRHRRILHLEFAGVRELPDGYAWHDYVSGGSAGPASAGAADYDKVNDP
jgi:hypothetical protein